MLQPPVPPDRDFARRYAGTFTYGFYLQVRNDVVDVITDSSVSAERWVVLNLNPQQISCREPFATEITKTQGGGKVVESNGGVVKMFQISGTTGYLPTPAGGKQAVFIRPVSESRRRGELVDLSAAAEEERAQRSGFYAFYRLRHLFRQYQHERRIGRTDVSMHYMDFKGDDFWWIEPQEFAMTRSSRKPFSYDYSISFTALEPSTVAVASVKPLVNSTVFLPFGVNSDFRESGVLQTIARMANMARSGFQFARTMAGAVQQKFQGLLRDVNEVVGFFEDAHSAFVAITETPLNMLKQLDNTIAGVFEVAGLFAPSNQLREINEWLLEMRMLNANMLSYTIDTYADRSTKTVVREDDKFSRSRAKQGVARDVMAEPEGSSGSPDANPFIGRSGLGLVTDVQKLSNNRALRTLPVQSGDTIYSLAQRYLGDVQRFVDLVIANQLAAPYIVASKTGKPAGTIAWGESIQIPAQSTGSQTEPSLQDASAPATSGSVTALGTTLQLVDEVSIVPWREDQWIGYVVTLTKPSGLIQRRVVVANDVDTLTVNYAWDTAPAVNDLYTLELDLFAPRMPVTEDSRLFGRDALVVFNRKAGATHQDVFADILLNARHDIATVSGLENFSQAVLLRTHSEQGRHPFHPPYGLALPVGRPLDADISLLFVFFARQSLLSDPRVSLVRQPRIDAVGDTVTFSAEVQPVRTKSARTFQVAR